MGYAKGWTSPSKYVQNDNVLEKIARLLRRIDPDIAALIEITPAQARELEKVVGPGMFSCKYHPIVQKVPGVKQYGNALLCKKKCAVRKRFLSSGLKRLVLETTCKNVRLQLVHLSLNKRARLRQIDELARGSSKRTVMLGDFNIKSEKELDPLVSNGLRPLVFSPTFPSWNPQKRFDQVLVSDDVKAKARVLQTKLSDHLPILIEIR